MSIKELFETINILSNYDDPSINPNADWHIASIRLWGNNIRGKKYIVGSFKSKQEAVDALKDFEDLVDLSNYSTVHFQYNSSRSYLNANIPSWLHRAHLEVGGSKSSIRKAYNFESSEEKSQ
jgi:hypothetical protein